MKKNFDCMFIRQLVESISQQFNLNEAVNCEFERLSGKHLIQHIEEDI